MKYENTVGVDLAKNVIYVSVVSSSQNILVSKELTRKKFKEFLAKQKPSLVAFEACVTAHYCSRLAMSLGHVTKILPALSVAPFRQVHKTDKNDALAVAEAVTRPNIKQAPYKTIDQQAIQSIQRSREILVGDRTARSNHIRGILLEFGIVIRQGLSALHQTVPEILEDGDNELPDSYRPTLNLLYSRLCDLRDDIKLMDNQITALIKQNPGCIELIKLEGGRSARCFYLPC